MGVEMGRLRCLAPGTVDKNEGCESLGVGKVENAVEDTCKRPAWSRLTGNGVIVITQVTDWNTYVSRISDGRAISLCFLAEFSLPLPFSSPPVISLCTSGSPSSSIKSASSFSLSGKATSSGAGQTSDGSSAILTLKRDHINIAQDICQRRITLPLGFDGVGILRRGWGCDKRLIATMGVGGSGAAAEAHFAALMIVLHLIRASSKLTKKASDTWGLFVSGHDLLVRSLPM